MSTKNFPAMMSVFERVAQERHRQNILFVEGHIPFKCASRVADPNRKLRVLMEEVGEVAEAIDLLETCKPGCKPHARMTNHLRDELTQVAAVAVAWLEAMEEK